MFNIDLKFEYLIKLRIAYNSFYHRKNPINNKTLDGSLHKAGPETFNIDQLLIPGHSWLRSSSKHFQDLEEDLDVNPTFFFFLYYYFYI